MVKVVIADTLHASALEILGDAGIEVIDVSKSKDKLSGELSDADALIVRSATKVNEDVLDNAPNLKIIGRAGVGLDNIDLPACESRGIKVVNSPEGPTRSVAELTLALLIIAARKLGSSNSGTKSGKWPKKNKGTELYGKTLGIIGSGAIGGTLAKYCIALGMRVIAYDIVKLKELEDLDGFEYHDFEYVISNADFISLHIPLVPATHHIIDKNAIDKMKDGVIIVNAARGGVIDEDALLDALNSGKVTAVALDVYEDEPVDNKRELIQHPDVFTTPHIGAQTDDASKNNTTIVCEKIIDHFNK